MAHLEKLELRERTLVIFIGDNGTPKGLHYRANGKIVEGGKATLLDSGTHVPMIVSWPGTAPVGVISDNLIDFADFLPTAMELAGVNSKPSHPLDGRSFLGQLLGEPDAPVRKFAFKFGVQNGGKGAGPMNGYWARTQRWKLYGDGRFFDMADDPAELSTIAIGSGSAEAEAARKQLQLTLDRSGAEEASRRGRQRKSDSKENSGLADIFSARGFDLDQVSLPADSERFPAEKLRQARFEKLTDTELFPEGPSYRTSDGSWFFSGNLALTRVDAEGKVHPILGKPGGGGTHVLPDGSILLIGQPGLRRIFPDGRIALLADAEETGPGNDLSVGIHGEVYFSAPSQGIYRLTPGADGKLEKVSDKNANGLEVDPGGKFIYVAGQAVERLKIRGLDQALGKAEKVYQFAKGKGGGDGCTFDAWGNFYTVRFKTGEIRVIDPAKKTLLAEIPTGVVPSSNLTFGGADNTSLLITAGAPKFENCQLLTADLGITGFCGHSGATDYPVVRWLEELGEAEKRALAGN